MNIQLGMCDESDRLAKLSSMGDGLERLDAAVDWEAFRPALARAVPRKDSGRGGRPPYDHVLMFKLVFLQRLYNLSDEQAEYQANDRRTFGRFLGLGPGDRVPDAKTIWLFKDGLARAGAERELFDLFGSALEEAGLVTRAGSIVDATFVDVPRQRNTREENGRIKEGGTPEGWEGEPNRLRQKDVDARWAKKGQETHFGYKDHVKADAESKLIVGYSVTPANVHDSKALAGLVDESDRVLYADSAYSGKDLIASLPGGVEARVCEKGSRGHPLDEAQKASNREKSRVRCRVEHVFGFMTNSMGGITSRAVGLRRNEFAIGIANLVYNLCRYEFLQRKAGAA